MISFKYLVDDSESDCVTRTDVLDGQVASILDGDVRSIEAAVLSLSRILASAQGQLWEKAEPEAFASWAGYLDKMTWSVHSGSDRAITRLLESYGGKPGRVLRELASAPPLEATSQARLAEVLDIDATYVSKIVRRLTEADLVSQWKEGRCAWVRVTAMGRAALQRVEFPAAQRGPKPASATVGIQIITTGSTEAGARALAVFATGKPLSQLWDLAA